MPNRKTHRDITRLFLQDDYNSLHHAKDWYSKILGRHHRIVGHDPITNVLLALQYAQKTNTDPLKAWMAATLHDYVDKIASEPIPGLVLPKLKNLKRIKGWKF